jgi:malate synthase
MTAPFMRAYTELLVKTCHRRGAHAMGGMAAFIPSRRDPEVNAKALAKVREDKTRESQDGFDGSWVAHPDLVALCKEVFDAALGSRPNQLDRLREDVFVMAPDLLAVSKTQGPISEAGLRNDVSVALQYLAAWLGGNGAVAIFNLMEDAATAEIARSQVWQWLHNDICLDDGPLVTRDLVERIIREELGKITEQAGAAFDAARYEEAVALFKEVALADDYAEFLTLPAYERMPKGMPHGSSSRLRGGKDPRATPWRPGRSGGNLEGTRATAGRKR